MKYLRIERCDGFQIIHMNWNRENPGFRPETFDVISSALRAADGDEEIRSTIFFGVPRCFCLGSDVNAFVDSANLEILSAQVLRFFRSLINSKKPLIAAVDGTAIGLGMTMLCHFDAVYATPESTFRAPFVDWGLLPEAASSLLLPEVIGHRRAFELFCLGGELSASDAEQSGLITRIVDNTELKTTAINAAKHLARVPERSLRFTRDLMRQNRNKLSQRAKMETTIFHDLLCEQSTQRRLKVMARAARMALAS